MKELLLVFLGGGIGTVSRWLIHKTLVWQPFQFPFAILLINAISCFIAGVITGLFLVKSDTDPRVKLFVLTGFCGGFSTLAALVHDNYLLHLNDKLITASFNVIFNIVVCSITLWLGVITIRVALR